MSVRSLGAAASGIDTMQTDLDTIGNDIANSETDGFKSGTAEFEDLLTEQLQPAGAASGTSLASTNPSSVGAGAEVSAIATDFSEGPVTQTGVSTDVAIEGNGFLVVSQNGQKFYTRDGDLQIDSNGNLATQSGGLVLGLDGRASRPRHLRGLSASLSGSAEPPAETQQVDLGGNLPAGSTTPVTVTTTLYDALGNAVPVALTFTPTGAANTWSMQGTVAGCRRDAVDRAADRRLRHQRAAGVDQRRRRGRRHHLAGDQHRAQQLHLDRRRAPDRLSRRRAPRTPSPSSPRTRPLRSPPRTGTRRARSTRTPSVPTAPSPAPTPTGRARRSGPSRWPSSPTRRDWTTWGTATTPRRRLRATPSSGEPGTDGLGSLQGGAVEGSNVDLATELTDLIEAQTAYQANTKVVDSTSTALQSLVEMS